MGEVFLETERLVLRRMTPDDFSVLCTMLQDIRVMYAWEYAFSDEQVNQWIERSLKRYEWNGFSYFIATDKQTGNVVGQIALLREEIEEKDYWGIGYILRKEYWGRGYATEGAKACAEYAFQYLDAPEVVADIRPGNKASRAVAERVGMTVTGDYVKMVCGKPMVHLIYNLKNPKQDSV